MCVQSSLPRWMLFGVESWKKGAATPKYGTSPWSYWHLNLAMSIDVDYLVGVRVIIVTNDQKLWMTMFKITCNGAGASILYLPRILSFWILHNFCFYFTNLYFLNQIFDAVFPITTDAVITSTVLRFDLTISSWHTNGVQQLEQKYICTRFYVVTNWL